MENNYSSHFGKKRIYTQKEIKIVLGLAFIMALATIFYAYTVGIMNGTQSIISANSEFSQPINILESKDINDNYSNNFPLSQRGTLSIYINSSSLLSLPSNVQNLKVNFSRGEILLFKNNKAYYWETLFDNKLITENQINNSQNVLLSNVSLLTGNYVHLRLYISFISETLKNGNTLNFTIPENKGMVEMSINLNLKKGIANYIFLKLENKNSLNNSNSFIPSIKVINS